MPLPADPRAVVAALPTAFPELCKVQPGHALIVHVTGSRVTVCYLLSSLTAGSLRAFDASWWAVAEHVQQALTTRGRQWTLGSGNADLAHDATVDHLPHRRWTKVTSGWSDMPGLALCAAACAAIQEPAS